jgi:hypothetical protein
MATKQKRKGRLPPFIALIKSTMATPAWRAMSPGARLLYIELRGKLSNNGSNNGKVYLSDRDGADAIGVNKETIVKYYAENEHYGFLRKTCGGFLGSDGRGIAAHYRFTDLAYGTRPPTRDFEQWDGEILVYTPSKKQKPVRITRTPCPENPDIRIPFCAPSVCTENPYIEQGSRCPDNPYISRVSHSIGQRIDMRIEAREQGSSTARAPSFGDAGSSPAPVANLTDMVLRMVNAELDQLEDKRGCGLAANIGLRALRAHRRNH